MIVCQCKGISDRVIRSAVAAGADTVPAVERACGAGTDCGGCRLAVAAVVRDACAPSIPPLLVSPSRLQTAV
jgi:bacterioferritin-associated ferredoxin